MKTRLAFQALGAFAVLAAAAAGVSAQAGAGARGGVAPMTAGGDVSPSGATIASGLLGEVATWHGAVTAVDNYSRQLTMREDDGTVRTLTWRRDATGTNNLVVGDEVSVNVLQPIGLSVRKGTDASGGVSVKSVDVAPAGRPKILNVAVKQTTASVVAVDQTSRIVMLKGDDGDPWSVKVAPQVSELAAVQAGDLVVVQYTEPLVLGVTK